MTSMDFSLETQKAYFGLKINKDVLTEKACTIEQVVDCLGIDKCEYVIGYDHKLAEKQTPHFHIHWTDTRSLAALQKAKQKAMPQWGHATKLYAAKDKKHGDVYCWFGYAVKETTVARSDGIDQALLQQHAHTQATIKQSRLNYAEQQIKTDKEKSTLEDKIFEAVNLLPTTNDYHRVALEICRQYYLLTDKPPRKASLDALTIKFLLKYKVWNIETLIQHYYFNGI